jgi:hypothetical protein
VLYGESHKKYVENFLGGTKVFTPKKLKNNPKRKFENRVRPERPKIPEEDPERAQEPEKLEMNFTQAQKPQIGEKLLTIEKSAKTRRTQIKTLIKTLISKIQFL